jgi:hypothetical protein|tara:strand:+ start:840 stop:1070 length:231 start_codon:yes stop_codon:yes gene_type:complete
MSRLNKIIWIIIFLQCLGLIYNKGFKKSNLYKEIICMKNTGESHTVCKKENKGLVEQKLPSKDMWNKMMKEKNNKK